MDTKKSKNIVEVYQDKNNLLERFNKLLKPLSPTKASGRDFSYFDGSELGSPVVVDDDLTKKWLEINYLFSTGFRPNRRPGVGEMGADIRTVKEIDGQKYLTIPVGLLGYVIKALDDFRGVEEACAEWLNNQERYTTEISGLYQKVKTLSEQHSQLGEFKGMFGRATGSIGLQQVNLPSNDFVDMLNKLSKSLGSVSEKETAREAAGLSKVLRKYSSLIPQLSEIREYHKNVPYLSDDGMIRINSPAASGGLCMHTHPGYDDSYHALPSCSDLILVAAQSGTIPMMMHIGGGETQGEHYVMHLPRKLFFEEVRQIVDKESVSREAEIIPLKQRVLDNKLDDLMDGEILGFKINGKARKGIAVLSPVVTFREYEKHKRYFESENLKGQPFGVKDLLLDFESSYALYGAEVKGFLAQNIGKLFGRK